MAVEMNQLESLILARTRRIVVTGEAGDGSAAARQFDAVAMCAGFKCSGDLLERLSRVESGRVIDIAAAALDVYESRQVITFGITRISLPYRTLRGYDRSPRW